MIDATTLYPTAVGLGAGGAVGYVVGYGLKKIFSVAAKVVACLAAVYAVSLIFLEEKGIISINYARFADVISATTSQAFGYAIGLGTSAMVAAAAIPAIAGFAGGIYFGATKA